MDMGGFFFEVPLQEKEDIVVFQNIRIPSHGKKMFSTLNQKNNQKKLTSSKDSNSPPPHPLSPPSGALYCYMYKHKNLLSPPSQSSASASAPAPRTVLTSPRSSPGDFEKFLLVVDKLFDFLSVLESPSEGYGDGEDEFRSVVGGFFFFFREGRCGGAVFGVLGLRLGLWGRGLRGGKEGEGWVMGTWVWILTYLLEGMEGFVV